MAVRPFVLLEAGNIKAQLQAAGVEIEKEADGAIKAAGRALDLLGEEMLAQAQAAAPVAEGTLQQSGTTEPLVIEGTELVKRFGFNSRYARMRDQGGTIRSSRPGGMLAIPLSDVAKKLASPLEQNDLDLVPLNGRLFLVERLAEGGTFEAKHLSAFHWMLVPEVTQQGNGFVTKTVEANKERVPQFVSEEVAKSFGGGA